MGALRILQVEDQEDIRDIVSIALSIDPEVELEAAQSGHEALDKLSGDYKPDVILLTYVRQ